MSNLTNADKATLPIGTRIRCTQMVAGLHAQKTKTEEFTVTGRRNAPKGLKLRLESQFGYGVNDVSFDHPGCQWEVIG